MCNLCENLDPRDEIIYATIALDGIKHLVSDVGADKLQFELTGPRELAELLDMVHKRISGAADKLQTYVPREHPLAV